MHSTVLRCLCTIRALGGKFLMAHKMDEAGELNLILSELLPCSTFLQVMLFSNKAMVTNSVIYDSEIDIYI